MFTFPLRSRGNVTLPIIYKDSLVVPRFQELQMCPLGPFQQLYIFSSSLPSPNTTPWFYLPNPSTSILIYHRSGHSMRLVMLFCLCAAWRIVSHFNLIGLFFSLLRSLCRKLQDSAVNYHLHFPIPSQLFRVLWLFLLLWMCSTVFALPFVSVGTWRNTMKH